MEEKTQILGWSVPECPSRITIPAPVINEIRILAVEAFYSVPRGGVEIGGVFFGTRETGTLHIQAHRPIRCQYATGPSFTLSIQDQLGLSGLLGQAYADPELAGMLCLGWYHSHNRSDLFLSPADLQLYTEFFPDRWQIAMVLRPANLQSTRGAFFFRDRTGAIKSDAPVHEFKLEPPTFGLTLLDAPQPDVALPDPVPATPAAVAVAQPVPTYPTASLPSPAPANGAVVSPREVIAALPPEPLVSPPFSPIPAAASVSASVVASSVVESSAAVAEAPSHPTPKEPAEAPAAAEPDAPQSVFIDWSPAEHDSPAAKEPPSETEPADINLPGFLAAQPVSRKRSTWIWAALAIILLSGAGGAAVVKWTKLDKSVDLGLETYDINGSFLIRWDRQSPIILSATHASIEIEDGGERPPVIELTQADLAGGGCGYIRRSSQVSVHMKVDGPTPAEEYSNFSGTQSLGSQPSVPPESEPRLSQALAEKEHLKTELINESMQSLELRREIDSLKRQLAEERAKHTSQGSQ